MSQNITKADLAFAPEGYQPQEDSIVISRRSFIKGLVATAGVALVSTVVGGDDLQPDTSEPEPDLRKQLEAEKAENDVLTAPDVIYTSGDTITKARAQPKVDGWNLIFPGRLADDGQPIPRVNYTISGVLRLLTGITGDTTVPYVNNNLGDFHNADPETHPCLPNFYRENVYLTEEVIDDRGQIAVTTFLIRPERYTYYNPSPGYSNTSSKDPLPSIFSEQALAADDLSNLTDVQTKVSDAFGKYVSIYVFTDKNQPSYDSAISKYRINNGFIDLDDPNSIILLDQNLFIDPAYANKTAIVIFSLICQKFLHDSNLGQTDGLNQGLARAFKPIFDKYNGKMADPVVIQQLADLLSPASYNSGGSVHEILDSNFEYTSVALMVITEYYPDELARRINALPADTKPTVTDYLKVLSPLALTQAGANPNKKPVLSNLQSILAAVN